MKKEKIRQLESEIESYKKDLDNAEANKDFSLTRILEGLMLENETEIKRLKNEL